MTLRIALGRARAAAWRLRGARVGAKSSIGRRVDVRRPSGITIGARVEIENDTYLKLVTDESRLTVGDYAFIGRGCELDIANSITIGAHVLLAPNVFITDHAHNHAPGRRHDEQGIRSAPVVIGDDAWIGTRAVILAGVTVGAGAIVGAGAVVTKNVEPNAIVAGVPARKIGTR
jgi:acetyltransferase-like isoleucine patch superfamily enzyme